MGPNGTQVAPGFAPFRAVGESKLFSVRSAVKPMPRPLGGGRLVNCSNQYPLHLIHRHLIIPPVIQRRSPRRLVRRHPLRNLPAVTLAWSSYNYPTAISASDVTGSEEVQFSYGPDRQRWKQIYTSPTPTETTYYVGGLIDVVFVNSTTNYRHYIYAGREPVAVYSRTAAGVNTMSNMLEDHQGGVSLLPPIRGPRMSMRAFRPSAQGEIPPRGLAPRLRPISIRSPA